MPIVSGVVSHSYRKKLGDLATGQLTDENAGKMSLVGGKFVIGCKGWVLQAGAKVRKNPDATLKFIESGYPLDGGDLPTIAAEVAGESYYFSKVLTNVDVSDDNQGNSTVTCNVALNEGNGQNGVNTTSDFFELGVFDKGNTMVAHITFEDEYKDVNKALQFVLAIAR